MFDNDEDFRQLVGDMEIDFSPSEDHRRQLEKKVISTFQSPPGRKDSPTMKWV